jgi:hypothetical protein
VTCGFKVVSRDVSFKPHERIPLPLVSEQPVPIISGRGKWFSVSNAKSLIQLLKTTNHKLLPAMQTGQAVANEE